MSRAYCTTSAIVFTLVALLHLWRVALDLPMTLGAWNIPRSLSVLAGVGAAGLAIWAFSSLKSGKPVRVAYT